MDFRYYPYSIPLYDVGQISDDRIFPGGGMGGPPGGPPPGFPGQPFPGGGPGQPPGFSPSQPPGFPPTGGGPQQQGGGPPSSPPPSFTPQMQQGVSAFAVDPGAIRGCLFRYTYVWLNTGRGFWFYPTFVGRTSVAGWRWRNFRWVYYGTDLNRIRNFQCF